MIPITPAIIGPGIDEEYIDAIEAITDLRRALGPRPLTNDTPDGRLLLEIAWVEQEIGRRQLPIPVDRSYIGTVYYLTGSGELDRVPGVKEALQRLYVVLQGIGLLKTRHIPVVISIIDNLLSDIAAHKELLNSDQQQEYMDLVEQSVLIHSNGWPAYRPPERQFNNLDAPNLSAFVPRLFYRLEDVNNALFENCRPIAARKPPLPAPVPGLPKQAPILPTNLRASLP